MELMQQLSLGFLGSHFISFYGGSNFTLQGISLMEMTNDAIVIFNDDDLQRIDNILIIDCKFANENVIPSQHPIAISFKIARKLDSGKL